MADNPNRLPRQDENADDMPIPPKAWNDICDMVEAANSLHCAPPLELTSTPTGKLLRLVPQARVVPLQLTATESSAGFYKGRSFMGSTTSIQSGSNTLMLPMGMIDPGVDNALVFDPSANNGGGSGLSPTSDSPVWVAGLEVGVTNETPPRTIYMLMGGGSQAIAQYQGQIEQAGADGRLSATFLRGYMLNPSGTNGT